MNLLVAVITILVATEQVFAARTAGCDIKLNNETEKNFPLILTQSGSHYKFVLPTRGSIHLAKGEDVVISCPDARNGLSFSDKSTTELVCASDNTFRIDSTHLNLDDIACKKTIRGEVEKTGQTCGGGGGKILKIGYEINNHDWITLIEVCYDQNQGNALYAEHILYGAEIKNGSKSSFRPSFSPEGIGKSIPASLAYKRSYQKSTFNSIFGSARYAERFINDKSFLARGHLAPDADFLFASWQYTTYYYINTAPQWQAINGGNWRRLEGDVRNFAAKSKKELKIITGTHDILKLPDSNGRQNSIYLTTKQKLPVPKYIWKIIFDERSSSGIVLVVSNNPFVERVSEDDFLCESICRESKWMKSYFLNYKQGVIHCCEYQEFKEAVETAPRLSIRQVLRY